MFNFPSSPTPGQAYIPVVGGPAYSWDGTVWRLTSGGISAGVYIGDTPPVNPPQGMLWFESDSGNTYIWFDDGTSAQWVQFNALATNAVVSTAEARNRLVNGGMQISQENGTSSGSASGYYMADQWMAGFVTSSTMAAARSVASGLQPYYVYVIASPAETSAAAGEVIRIQTSIEGTRVNDFGWGGASRQAVIAFDVNVPVAGTYWVALTNNAATHTWLGSYTISAAEAGLFVRKSVVIPAGAINAGVWPTDTTRSAILSFTFHCGSTWTGVAGFQTGNLFAGPGQALGLSTAAACVLSNVGLYLDPNNTGLPPAWQMPDEAEELRACLRYYYKATSTVVPIIAGVIPSSAFLYGHFSLPATMRVPPTLAFSNIAYTNSSGLAFGASMTDAWRGAITGTAAGTALATFQWAANARM